eukprot:TRINITY_DN9675_c0_g1_i1.p1 TRINITY_DN9675_c0_g1~~TRINITY_DN9675_c0_g1_i1.p1  ORF type:complete len:179 (+),score=27.86 TRINITY_DN9675_c0_g1_i1:94-630(+)
MLSQLPKAFVTPARASPVCVNGFASVFTAKRHFSREKKHYKRDHILHNSEEIHTLRQELQHNKDKHEPIRRESNTVMNFSITPVGLPLTDTSLSSALAATARVLLRRGTKHEVHALGVVIEGPIDECFEAVAESVFAVLKRAPRCTFDIHADIRPGHENRIQKKHKNVINIESVTEST